VVWAEVLRALRVQLDQYLAVLPLFIVRSFLGVADRRWGNEVGRGGGGLIPAAKAWGYAWPVGVQPLRRRWMLQLQMSARRGWFGDPRASTFVMNYRRTSISGTTLSGKKCLSATIFHAI
jgi:hypothetical protein